MRKTTDTFGCDADIEGSKVLVSGKCADKGNVGAAVLYDYWSPINSS